jgi:ATP adenylyltransferase
VSAVEHLWNGWRSAYVGGSSPAPPGDGSVFTRLLNSGLTDEETYIVHRSRSCFALLNAFPYSTGHLLVVPYREVPDLTDLDVEEAIDLWSTVHEAVRALRASHQPAGLNVGINMGPVAGGSIAEHLHVHVVPRWLGDSNFMTAIANTRTLPEALIESAERVRNAWPSSGGGPKVHV